jgi:hypothetical protein
LSPNGTPKHKSRKILAQRQWAAMRLLASPAREAGLAVLAQLAPGQLVQADIEHRRQKEHRRQEQAYDYHKSSKDVREP